ncbi:peptidase inhibitor family I36 protein [Streptomyces sp. NPDC091371]|uniref:peptidase inhibitor family I36 protein n=1 Tax=Streptomyces sp. NPDC091371 TaxID=3155303 RepID=UPI003419BE42
MNKNLRGLRLAAAPAAIAVAMLVGAAAPASAWARDGYLEPEEMGLYYLVNRGGCVFDYNNNEETLTDNQFNGPAGCDGRTKGVNDNTESYWNRDNVGWYVYTDWKYGGIKGSIPSGYTGNASANYKNKISSSSWYW